MHNINTLCISGGGTKGVVFLGAIQHAIKIKLFAIENIKTFIGVSIGAIISFLLSINYSIEDIIQFILNFNLMSLEPEIDCDNLFNNLGLDDGTKIIYLLKNFLKNKLNLEKLTLNEHFKLTENKIIIAATNFTLNKIEYFDYTTHPDLDIIDAIRMSFSIPGFFTPFSYNDNLYIDGGILDNFPIQLGNEKTTLGLVVNTKFTDSKNIEIHHYMYKIFNLTMNANTLYKINQSNAHIIKINLENESMLNYSMDAKYKETLLQIGKKHITDFYQNIIETNVKLILYQIIDEIVYSSSNL